MLRNTVTVFFIQFVVAFQAYGSTTIVGEGSTFVMTYDELYTPEYQEVMNEAARFWADTVRSSVPITVHVGQTSKTCGYVYNAHVATVKPAAVKNFTNTPQIDVHYPVALANSLAGSDLTPNEPDIYINYNRRIITSLVCQKWYLGYDANFGAYEFSLYFETLQEIAHGLGFTPLGDLFNAEPFDGIPDVFWTKLKSNSLGKWLTELPQSEAVALARNSGDLVLAGEKTRQAATHLENAKTADGVLLFSRTYNISQLSGMHFHEYAEPLQLMAISLRGAIPETDLTVAVLEDLGWNSTRNSAPVIQGQSTLSVNEDNALALWLSDFTIADETPEALTLTIENGSHYTVSDNTITPVADFNGTLTVPVSVSDGEYRSDVFYAAVSVLAVNDKPQITGYVHRTVDEDQSLTLSLADLIISDVDSDDFTMKVSSGSNYSVVSKTITPLANYNGLLTLPVTVNDGDEESDAYQLTVIVNPVNDAPLITRVTHKTIKEDTSLTLTLDDVSISDIDSSRFTLNVMNGEHYQTANNTITPEADFSGLLQVPVSVSDGSATSATTNLMVDVVALNDAPVLNATPVLSIPEDSELTVSLSQLDFADEDSDTFSLILGDGAHYELNGDTLIPDENYFGSLSVPVQISDGTELSNEMTMTVHVTAVNDAPVITSLPRQSILEDTTLEFSQALMTIKDPDSNDLTLNIGTGEHYQVVGGTTIQPDANFYGVLNIPVTVNDGAATSAPATLTLEVISQNDLPVLNAVPNPLINEDSVLGLTQSQFDITDVDSSQFTLVLGSGAHYDVNGESLIPEAHFFGTLSVPVQISDGEDLSNSLVMTVTVAPVNDAPVITSLPAQSILEDTSLLLAQDLVTIEDPDSTEFTISIGLGEHYQVAGAEILPEADWFGELSIPLTVSDGDATSDPVTLTLTVEPVNDWPELLTRTLPQGQIYRALKTQLNATDIENDALTFALGHAPDWINLSDDGEFSVYTTDENNIGEHSVEVIVSDGLVQVASTLSLIIEDDPTATDLTLTTEIERTIWSTTGWVPLTVKLTNHGPMSPVDAHLAIDFAGEWTSQDSRCNTIGNECLITVSESETFTLNVRHSVTESQDLLLTISHDGYDYQTENNHDRLTLTFTDGNPTTPQYTVPNFGEGTVRTIALADIQGGRWPEILFANGPTEASTSYRFEHSLFRPVLHSHLADAADSYDLSVFDIDGDGNRDWVLANGNGEANSVYRNDGNGDFELVGLLGHYNSRAVAHGDFDMDGDQDLIFANADDPNTLYLNDGHGHFTLAKEFDSCYSRRVLVYDFNHDGRPDFIFMGRGYRHRLFLNHGFQRRSTVRMAGLTIGTAPSDFETIEFGDENDLTADMQLADLDGDGEATDLVAITDASDSRPAALQVFSIAIDGTASLTSETSQGSVTDLSIGDYNGDGKDDVAVLRPGGALELLENQGGALATFEVMDTNGADTIILADVDGSGQADVISANNHSKSSQLDFTGNVDNAEDTSAGGSNDVSLPVSSDSTASVTHSGSLGAGFAGWLLLGLLTLTRRRY